MKNPFKIVLKTHGIFLLCLGLIMSLQTLLGRFKGAGPLKFLEGNSLRSVGLFEAYLLAAFSGAVLLILSGKHYNRQRHLLAATVHLILFTTNVTFWEAYAQADIVTIGWVSTIAHAVFILLESSCYLMQKSVQPEIK